MITTLTLIGTRPEAIKLAPVLRELEARPDRVRSVVCATGQHREMLDQALGIFGIRPDFDLDVMSPDQSLTQLTASLLTRIDAVVRGVRPELVLVQGDTTTVMAGALVAHYHRVPVGHVEAGLRTGDPYRPFPEETNRRIADLLSGLYFAPTEAARANLLREGVDEARVTVTGNTAIDAVLQVARQPYDWSGGPLAAVPGHRRLVTITAHRRESFGAAFRDFCLAIRDLAGAYAERVHFVYPVHLNPSVRGPVHEVLSDVPNVSLLEPLDYRSFVHLLSRSELVLTDSGGVQEEAPALDVPVLVMRDVTERPEGLEAGTARLVGTSRDSVRQGVERLLESPEERGRMAGAHNPFGDGRAAERVVGAILEHFASGRPASTTAR